MVVYPVSTIRLIYVYFMIILYNKLPYEKYFTALIKLLPFSRRNSMNNTRKFDCSIPSLILRSLSKGIDTKSKKLGPLR